MINYMNSENMKKAYFIVLSGFCFLSTSAQINSNIFPPNGAETSIISCTSFDPLTDETGPDAVWDFSTLNCDDGSLLVTFFDAEGSEEADNFPEANKYLKIDVYDYSTILIYSNVNEDFWEIHGVKYDDNYFHVNGGETIMQFPGQLDDNWMDDNIWIAPSLDSVHSNQEYTIDGQGTLILPNATYENVYRVHSVRPTPIGLFTADTYTYYSPDYHYHLFQLLVGDESHYQPNPIKIITSTNNIDIQNALKLSPNPINGNASFKIELDIQTTADINLFSVEGQKVYSKKKVMFTNGTYFIDPGIELSPGIYFLHVIADGKRFTSKLISN